MVRFGRGGVALGLCLFIVVTAALNPPPRAKKVKHREDTVHKSDTLHFLSTKKDQPLSVPIVVEVLLVGLEGEGQYHYKLDEEDLQESLFNSLGRHNPSCMETGEQLAIRYDISYKIRHVALTDGMHNVLKESMKPDETIPNLFNVDILDVEAELNTLAGNENSEDDAADPATLSEAPFRVLVMNPDMEKMRPRGISGEKTSSYTYRYSLSGGGYSQSWISLHRYVVVDLSAGPCQYGNSNAGEGTVSNGSIPRVPQLKVMKDLKEVEEEEKEKSDEAGDDSSDVSGVRGLEMNSAASFQAKLGTVIVSAVRHVFLPDIRFDDTDFAEKVIVPVVILRNHKKYDPLEKAKDLKDYHIDIEFIRSEIKRMMLPKQQLVLHAGVHLLHELKHISMAVAKATKSDTVHEAVQSGKYYAKTKSYLDSKTLHQEMKGAAGVLAANYEGFKSSKAKNLPPNASEGKAAKRSRVSHDHGEADGFSDANSASHGGSAFPESHGTRFLPVYVFSLTDFPDQLLLDKKDMVSVTRNAAMILQNDADKTELPYFADYKVVSTQSRNVNRHIVAGIAMAMGGLTAPYERYSQPHKRVVDDFLWANGHHPFGPFSNSTLLSDIYIDNVLRNSIVSRLHRAIRQSRQAVDEIQHFAEEFIFDPFGGSVQHSANDQTWIDHIFHQSSGLFGFHLPGKVPLAPELVQRLYKEIESLEAQFVEASEEINDFKLKAAYSLSASLLQTASAFQRYVHDELDLARKKMDCCTSHHAVKSSLSAPIYFGLVAFGLIVAALVICGGATVATTGRRKSRRQ